MTPAAESTPDDRPEAPSKVLSTTDDADSFLPGAGAVRRSLGAWLLDYSAHAAMIVGLVGFAWTVSNHVVNRSAAPAQPPADHASADHAAAPAPGADELVDLRHANRDMAEDIRRLRANLDQLSGSLRDDRTPTEVRALRAGLETVRNGLSTARGETTAAVAQINGKLDRIEHEPAGRLQQLGERVGRLEKNAVDPAPTGSVVPKVAASPAAVPVPPVKPAPARVASLEEPRKPAEARRAEEARPQDAAQAKPADGKGDIKADAKPPVLPGYVVRDVYEGVAVIEGRHGPMEVVPGVSIPGAGVVKSIERHGSGWTVTTTKGLLAYAAPPKDYRRVSRGYYPAYREEF